MRVVGLLFITFFLGLVMLSMASIIFAIRVPSSSRAQVATTAEAVPGPELSGPAMTHTAVPAASARLVLSLLPLGLVVLLVVGGIGAVVRLTRSDGKSGSRESPDEVRMMQEIYQGLSGLERRVESLETLLLDRAMAREGEGWKRG
jgi:phage shock protein B